MQKIIYSNKQQFLETLENMKNEGLENLHFLADFDRTLTKAFCGGEKNGALMSVFKDNPLMLSEEFCKKEQENFDKYYPIEVDPNISLEEKIKAMNSWWKATFDLLIKYGLTKNKIKQASDSRNVCFRDGVKEFLEFLNKNQIPLIIISASGLGIESIKYFFEKNNLLFDNIYIISNDFIWDEQGKAIGYKEPIIHSFNKGETILKDFPEIFVKIKNRKNVILLGDSLGDHHMVDGFDYNNLINIGFLNDFPHHNPLLGEEREQKEKEFLEEYIKRYDVVITGDGDFGVVNDILKEIGKGTY